MIDDPPTILRLRVPGRPGRVWLLDCRNWGVEPEGEHASASDEARWLAGVMRRMVDALVGRGWGGLKATAGSQALATWRRAFMTHDVVAHNDDDVLELEQSAYVGGRCECGVIGTVPGPLYSVDRRSAYAHACAEWEVPLRVLGVYPDGEFPFDHDSERCGRCVAECRLSLAEASYPCPSRDGFRYPVGNVRAVLAGPEFRDAVERGAVAGVGRVVEYECGPALAAYATALWGARKEFAGQGDRELKAWVKKLLVSLPGKLGQRVAEWREAPAVEPPAPWCCWWGIDGERKPYRLRALSGSCQRQDRSGWTYDAVPAVACFVLSAARLELLRSIRVAGWSECLYWDTDSLLLTARGWERLTLAPGMVGPDLGQWRLVRAVNSASILGVKHYVHDGDVTCAGMPKADTAESRLINHYWYRQTFGIALGESHAPSAARRLREYKRPPRYDLGRVGDGGRVYPFVREDW